MKTAFALNYIYNIEFEIKLLENNRILIYLWVQEDRFLFVSALRNQALAIVGLQHISDYEVPDGRVYWN